MMMRETSKRLIVPIFVPCMHGAENYKQDLFRVELKIVHLNKVIITVAIPAINWAARRNLTCKL